MGEKGMLPEQRVASRQRQGKALELRKAGMTYQQIAEALGYGSISAAEKAVKSGLKMIVREPAEELRTLEIERLDRMFAAHWKKVLNGDVRSTEVALKIMERRAKLLGLDAPTRVNVDLLVQQAAEELQLTPDERVRLHDDVAAFMAQQAAESTA